MKKASMTAEQVANQIIIRCNEQNIPIDNMKLQCLLYYAYGWHLATTGERLFDEPIWAYPPMEEAEESQK